MKRAMSINFLPMMMTNGEFHLTFKNQIIHR